jgi:hypothetical protein
VGSNADEASGVAVAGTVASGAVIVVSVVVEGLVAAADVATDVGVVAGDDTVAAWPSQAEVIARATHGERETVSSKDHSTSMTPECEGFVIRSCAPPSASLHAMAVPTSEPLA